MAKLTPERQIKKLREQIAEMDRLYYKENRPAMADMEYDFLKKQLEALETAHPQLKSAASPTAGVGSDLTGEMPTVRHKTPMLSLENSYSREELEGFDSRLRRALAHEGVSLEYVVEPKVDGLSISVVYENGKLVRAVTRGDGEEGEVVTQNFLTIASVPREWPIEKMSSLVELRGEVYLTHEQFEKINAEREEAGLELYANPRNLAAGTLKLKDDVSEVAQRGLRVVFYALGAGREQFASQSELLEFLAAHEFPAQAHWWKAAGIQEAWAKIEELDALRKGFLYPTDGAVIKLNSFAQQLDAGFTARSPRWAFAYKYAPERAETKLRAITIQVGRTGVLTPVAELDPVELSGSTVARATLHNADEIARKDIRVGDTVVIEKAGEVIPAVVAVVLQKRPMESVPYEFPKSCPSCGALVMRVEDEVAWRCPNPDCPEQRKRSLEHFASRNAMAIDGLGEAVVAQLVGRELVKTPGDLYALGIRELLSLEGFAEKSALNLLSAIEKSKQNDLWRLLHALGIPQVGETVAQELAAHFGSLDSLASAAAESLLEMDGIGECMAKSIAGYFADEKNKELLVQLKKYGVNTIAREVRRNGEGPLAGKKFVLTGELHEFTREQAKERLELMGGKVVDSVSKNTDAVIAGERAGSKLEKARTLGVAILDEEAFKRLLQENS